MKIGFVHGSMEHLGIEYLSAMLKKAGHKTKLIFDPQLFSDNGVDIRKLSNLFDSEKMVIDEILNADLDILAFSVISDNYNWACKLAKAIKERINIPIIFGGIHPTSTPLNIIKEKFVDFIIIGESEQALLDLVNGLESSKKIKNIKNVWCKNGNQIIKNDVRPLIQNLDKLPFPDKSLFCKINRFNQSEYSIITTRGCPHTCSYCNNSVLKNLYKTKGNYLRKRSTNNVIEELKVNNKKFNIKSVIFYDEIFTHDFTWLKEFLKKYRNEIDKPFWCYVHPDFLSKEIINLLQKSKCKQVEMGVQTLNKNICQKYLHRPINLEKLSKILKSFNKTSILCTVSNMSGIPTQTEKDLINSIRFYNKNKPDFIYNFWLRYYPQTEIKKILKKTDSKPNPKRSLFLEGDTYNKKLARLHNLMYISHILPKNVLDLIIQKKIYKLIPSKHMPLLATNIQFYYNRIKNFARKNKKERIHLKGTYKLYSKYMLKNISYKLIK